MRVVAGALRGRRLVAPDGLATRPTTDRVREAVFNSLAAMDLVVDATYADLFAGTGALGIEALSRGARHCTFVEKDQRALRALRENLASLDVQDRATVVPGDALSAIARLSAQDVVVADPPYGFDQWEALLARLPAEVAVLESGHRLDALPAGWELAREKRYGRTFVAVLRRSDPLP
jgi:16S rRNA (guanine966-N2)-methyltransferase